MQNGLKKDRETAKAIKAGIQIAAFNKNNATKKLRAAGTPRQPRIIASLFFAFFILIFHPIIMEKE